MANKVLYVLAGIAGAIVGCVILVVFVIWKASDRN